MKSVLFLILALFVNTIVLAQEAAVQFDRQNIMYVGIPNPITVVARNTPCSSLTITIDSGEVRNGSAPCKYDVYVQQARGSILNVYKNTKKGRALIASQWIWLRSLPDALVKVAGRRNDTIRKSMLAVQLGIVAYTEGFDIQAKYQINYFKILINRNNKTIFSKTVYGARFDDEVIQQFKSLKTDDFVFIYDISANGPNRRNRNLDPIYLKITE